MHSERHVHLYGTNPLSRLKLDNGKLAGRAQWCLGPSYLRRLISPTHPKFLRSQLCQPVPPASLTSPHLPPCPLCCPSLGLCPVSWPEAVRVQLPHPWPLSAGLLAQRIFVMLPCGGVGVSVPGVVE